MDNFQSESQAFLDEFKSQAQATFHPSLQITDLRDRNAGRGIIATADVPTDTELFTIPRDYVISVENSELSRVLPQIFGDDHDVVEADGDEEDEQEILPRPWLNLILVLIHDYLHRETSKWRSYWDVLPWEFNTLIFWTDDQLLQLQASSVRGRIGRDDADKMFRQQIIPVVRRHADTFYPFGMHRMDDDELMTLAHRMGSLIMAYAFDLEKDKVEEEDDSDEDAEGDGWAVDREGQTAMGMVPMADMLNADAEFNAHLEHGTASLTMRSLRVIKAGEEVLNYYGPLPNSDLLRRYGYTSEKHARYDVVEMSWDLITRVIDEHFGRDVRVSSLEETDLEESFVLERECGDPDETGQNRINAKFSTFPEELVEQITVFSSEALGINSSMRGKPSEHEKRRLKHAVLQIIEKSIDARLAEYGTTVEQDEALLAEPGVDNRSRMAIEVRLGEKRLLREAQDFAKGLLSKYSDMEQTSSVDETPDERPSKRQKKSR